MAFFCHNKPFDLPWTAYWQEKLWIKYSLLRWKESLLACKKTFIPKNIKVRKGNKSQKILRTIKCCFNSPLTKYFSCNCRICVFNGIMKCGRLPISLRCVNFHKKIQITDLRISRAQISDKSKRRPDFET